MMKRKMYAGALGGVLLVFAGAGFAQNSDGDLQAGQRWLQLMNHKGDKDDTISRAEFNRYMDRQFLLADADHDGTLDATELGHLHRMLLGN